MGHKFADIVFTDAVKFIQTDMGSRQAYSKMEEHPEDYNHILSVKEMEFISARDSLYMATVSETGWPYVQHRGGPVGFVKILNDTTIAMPDFRGNRQYVSVGNLKTDDRVSLFFMDYANKARLKVLGHACVIDQDDEIASKLALPEYRANIERGLVIKVAAFDWNCPQHIPDRFSGSDVKVSVSALTQKIIELEEELALQKWKAE